MKENNILIPKTKLVEMVEQIITKVLQEDSKKSEDLKEGVTKNNPKIEKIVNDLNDLISKAVDSDGDPIGVVDPSTTWEEPFVYKVEYKNGILKITSHSEYGSKKSNVEVIKSGDVEEEGVDTLKLLTRMYKKAVKNKDSKKSEDLTENKKQNKFDKVMGEFEKGELKSSNGKKVTDKKQALAIAYSESGLNEANETYIGWLLGMIHGTKSRKLINGNVAWYKDGLPLMIQNFENGWLQFDYEKIWKVLCDKFGLNNHQIQELLSRVLYNFTSNGTLSPNHFGSANRLNIYSESGLNEAYGDKRDFKKIEIFVKGKYVGTTTWAKGLKEAKEKFLEKNSNVKPEDVVVKFAELN
jgi:hypothetical protein